jgi:hypothetical protein
MVKINHKYVAIISEIKNDRKTVISLEQVDHKDNENTVTTQSFH